MTGKHFHGIGDFITKWAIISHLGRITNVFDQIHFHGKMSPAGDFSGGILLHVTGDRAFPVAAARLWNSLPSDVTAAPLSPSSAVVLNHISSHFLIPLSDSSLICTVPALTHHFEHYNCYANLELSTCCSH